MKVKTYVRVGYDSRKRKSKVEVSQKPNYAPVRSGSGYGAKLMPTVAFAIVLDIPDGAFARAEEVLATLELSEDVLALAGDVSVEEAS